jgi:predicted enzyme related to lactoylglutathione lyase
MLCLSVQQQADQVREERSMKEDSLKHGAFGWMELMTTDVESAKGFYARLFGWEAEEYAMEGMEYSVIKLGGDDVGGIMSMPPEMAGMPPMWGIYVTVDDVDATANKVVELGGTIIRPPSDIPSVGRFCVLSDPQGGIISAITYVAASA